MLPSSNYRNDSNNRNHSNRKAQPETCNMKPVTLLTTILRSQPSHNPPMYAHTQLDTKTFKII